MFFLLLSSESLSLFAQESSTDNIPCQRANGGSCAVAGTPGVCEDFRCNTSTESQSGTTYPAVENLSSGLFNGIKSFLPLIKKEYEIAAASTTNSKVSAAAKTNLAALNPKLEQLTVSLTKLESIYNTELALQKGRGAAAKDAHFAAANKATAGWSQIFTREVSPVLRSPPALAPQIQGFFTDTVRSRMGDFAISAKKIQEGAPITDPSITIYTDPDQQAAADAIRAAIAAGNKSAEDAGACSIFPGRFDLETCLNAFFSWIARVVFVNIAFFFFFLSGTFLHFTIHFGLVSMKSLITEDVYTLWLFTRNLALAGCLFATLYFVGMYLVGLGEKIQKQAAAVILFAIFSGFSFTLSTYLIDGSTLITTSLYSSIDSNWADPSLFAKPVIASRFAEQLGWQGWSSIIGAVSDNSVLGKISQGDNLFSGVALNLFVALTLLYDAWVLFMMGVLFLVRNIGLFVAVIFSPLLLIDKAIPKLCKWADWYRKFFFGLLALGPVFMFLMYIALKVTEVILTGVRSLSGQAPGNQGILLFQIFTVTAIFYFTYKTCKSLSGALGDAALGAVSGVASKAFMATPLGVAGRVAAFAGQNTVGRLARRSVREGGALSNMKEKGGYFGRAAFSAANYAGNTATYDFNNTKAFAGARGRAEKMGGMSSSESAVGKALGYADTRTKIRDETISHANEINNEEGRRTALERGARRFDRATSILPSLKLVDRAGDKFLGGDDRGSKRVNRKSSLEEEMRRGSEKNAKTAIDDKVSSLGLQDYADKSEDEQVEMLNKLTSIYKDSKKASPEVQKHAKKALDNELVSFFSNSVKHGERYDPLSPDFEAQTMAEFITFTDEIGNMLGLAKDDKDRAKNDPKILEKFELQMGIFVTEKKKEAEDKAERQAKKTSLPSNNPQELIDTNVLNLDTSRVERSASIPAFGTGAVPTFNEGPDGLGGFDFTTDLGPNKPASGGPSTATASKTEPAEAPAA